MFIEMFHVPNGQGKGGTAMLKFDDLKKELERAPETILVLGKDENGGVKILKNLGEGTEHSVMRTMALMQKAGNPDLIYIQELK